MSRMLFGAALLSAATLSLCGCDRTANTSASKAAATADAAAETARRDAVTAKAAAEAKYAAEVKAAAETKATAERKATELAAAEAKKASDLRVADEARADLVRRLVTRMETETSDGRLNDATGTLAEIDAAKGFLPDELLTRVDAARSALRRRTSAS